MRQQVFEYGLGLVLDWVAERISCNGNIMILLAEQLEELKLGLDSGLSLNQTKHRQTTNGNHQWHLEDVHFSKVDGEADYWKTS